MKWKPIAETDLWDQLNNSWERMSIPQRKLWEVIKILPQKWAQEPWGNEGGGFWVVAIYGNTIVWFNDIEEGFNRSSYSKYGTINEYWCNQDELEWVLQHLLDEIREGNPSGGYAGPPEEIA